MKHNYIIDYINENEFRKKERAIKKYVIIVRSLEEGECLWILMI